MAFACESAWLGGRSAVVTVHGELDMLTAPRLQEELDRLRRTGISDYLVIDLTRCTFMDSSGLGVLAAAQRDAKSPLNIVAVRRQIVHALTISGLAGVFNVHITRAEALRELERQVGPAGQTGHDL